MGISVDAPPIGPPQTNAYDVHNIQQGAAPWQSSGLDSNAYVCYQYQLTAATGGV